MIGCLIALLSVGSFLRLTSSQQWDFYDDAESLGGRGFGEMGEFIRDPFFDQLRDQRSWPVSWDYFNEAFKDFDGPFEPQNTFDAEMSQMLRIMDGKLDNSVASLEELRKNHVELSQIIANQVATTTTTTTTTAAITAETPAPEETQVQSNVSKVLVEVTLSMPAIEAILEEAISQLSAAIKSFLKLAEQPAMEVTTIAPQAEGSLSSIASGDALGNATLALTGLAEKLTALVNVATHELVALSNILRDSKDSSTSELPLTSLAPSNQTSNTTLTDLINILGDSIERLTTSASILSTTISDLSPIIRESCFVASKSSCSSTEDSQVHSTEMELELSEVAKSLTLATSELTETADKLTDTVNIIMMFATPKETQEE